MIRFIDIRNQGTGYRFAFLDTSTDRFVKLDDLEVFDSYKEIEDFEMFTASGKEKKKRLLSLCPEWTKDGKQDDLCYDFEDRGIDEAITSLRGRSWTESSYAFLRGMLDTGRKP